MLLLVILYLLHNMKLICLFCVCFCCVFFLFSIYIYIMNCLSFAGADPEFGKRGGTLLKISQRPKKLAENQMKTKKNK